MQYSAILVRFLFLPFQVPIGMVADSSLMRRWQVAALVGFSAVQVALFMGICILGLVINGWGRVAIVALGGGVWLALLLFNMRMAGRPRPIIQSFLHAKKKSKLSPAVKKGSVVVVRGAVSLLHEELLSTEFHNVPVGASFLFFLAFFVLKQRRPVASGRETSCGLLFSVRAFPGGCHPVWHKTQRACCKLSKGIPSSCLCFCGHGPVSSLIGCTSIAEAQGLVLGLEPGPAPRRAA